MGERIALLDPLRVERVQRAQLGGHPGEGGGARFGIAERGGERRPRHPRDDHRAHRLVHVQERRRHPGGGGAAQDAELLCPLAGVAVSRLDAQHQLAARTRHRVDGGAGRAPRHRLDRRDPADPLLGQEVGDGGELGGRC